MLAHMLTCVSNLSCPILFCSNTPDSGGGNVPNAELNNASVTLQWMINQSATAGLRFESSTVKWDVDDLARMRPKNSMTLLYRLIELLPITHLTYQSATETAWYVSHLPLVAHIHNAQETAQRETANCYEGSESSCIIFLHPRRLHPQSNIPSQLRRSKVGEHHWCWGPRQR